MTTSLPDKSKLQAGCTGGEFSTAIGDLVDFTGQYLLPDGSGIASVNMSGHLNEYKGVDIASATVIDLGAATGNFVNITGTVPITELGTVQAGTRRIVTFAGALTLTHDNTKLKLPGAANIPTVAGDRAQFTSLGSGNWQCDWYTKANGMPVISGQASISGAYKNLKIDALGASNYNCVITADEVVLENSSNQYITARNVSKTINANGTVGAPLSIMSTRAASTWYYRWLWYNATNGLTATLDTSRTSSTAPTGYSSTDYKCVLPGACRTDSSGNTYLIQISTVGNKSHYVVTPSTNTTNMPLLASGATGSITTPTWIAVSVSNFVPPSATIISITGLTVSGSVAIMVAPNSSYGAHNSTSNPPPFVMVAASSQVLNLGADIPLESSNIYWATAFTAYLFCKGWEE